MAREIPANQLPYFVLVLDEQHGAASGRRLAARRLDRRGGHGCVGSRQQNPDGGSDARLAVANTQPSFCLTMPYTVARPRPDPLPISLVVKNGSNSRSSVSGLIPAPRVADPDLDIVAGRHVGPRSTWGVANWTFRGPNRQLAAVGHGVARVRHEIDHDLVKLSGIGANVPDLGPRIELDVDVLADHRVSVRRISATVSFTSSTRG